MSGPLGIGLPAIGNDQTAKGRSGGQKGQDAGDVFSQAIDRLSAKDSKGQRGGAGNGQARAEASSNGKGDIEVDITSAPRGGREAAGVRDIGGQDRSSLLAIFENAANADSRATDASKPDDFVSQDLIEDKGRAIDAVSDSADATDLTQDPLDLPSTQALQGSGVNAASSLQQALSKSDTISAWLQSRGATTNVQATAAEGHIARDGPDAGALPESGSTQVADGEMDVFRKVGGKGDVPTMVIDAVARSIAQGMVKGDTQPDGTKNGPIRLDGASRGANADGLDPDLPRTLFGIDGSRGSSEAAPKTSATTPADRLADLGGRQKRADNLLRSGVDLAILESRKFLGVAAGQTSTAGIISTVTENGEWNAMLRDVASTSATTLDTARNASNTLKIQLNPVELGTVTATFRMSGGHLTIELKVETIEAYRQLSDDQSGLAKALKAQGIDAQNVVVQHVGSDRSTQSANPGATASGAAGQQGQAEGGSSQHSAAGQQRGEGGSDSRRGSGREQGDADARRTDRTASGDVYL
ncbi:flagellar hook-length control protein FliK [Rhizobium sp. EC-SD404]|uniref:flagellar hook-length control protein FliK n=1 Tax=Rhizobium sp. EC-SD404 TaxID=2038389 RepID=UPI001251E55D|nr:flagellar hook-length control protein FliK [Rhizobium sp. EC-SD404]VVT32183.1 hypothetical protein RHIZ404_230515 [Rhizobium sp. EC-SD404]